MQNIGQRIRISREQKKLSLNKFAELLGVSPSYLSNLERGNTKNIDLDVLMSLNEQLHLFPLETKMNSNNEYELRLSQVTKSILQLNQSNPAIASFLLSQLEYGVETFINSSMDRMTHLSKSMHN
ncbi:helix-turn-helix domain-containing protein [Paenibacillus endoradicis]|uniref:helix-turn-helix domain-containing protein n=1 Tax=Paenibacillus endoradicis TaxID=2972487 RepID=UPI0021599DCA|nr:helix-turn-helix transcriptional regulator [Paenibacillus endoradicis]MCR8655836.1 helix-turn-helix domain-containing protein [Paenibacillus endoradicis]MCR8658162.1 helix-turn-helix domain-containing protein [Paenibacillus endoradicis]